MSQSAVARVALSGVLYAIDRPYDYLIPPELEGTLRPGMRVIVPFGRGNRRTDGMVIALAPSTAEAALKPVLAVLDEEPVLDEHGLKLALWLRERCFCTVYDAVKAMLPSGLYFSLRDLYRLADGVDRESAYAAAGRSEAAQKVLTVVFANDGAADLEQIRMAFGTKSPGAALRQLVDSGTLVLETSAMRGVGDKTEQIATLAMPAEEAMALVAPRRKSAPLRYAVTELLCTVGSASVKELCYFTGASTATVRSLSKSGVLTLEKQPVFRTPCRAPAGEPPSVSLNEEQQKAFQALGQLAARREPAVSLLYGVTGSGKTQVYIRLIRRVLEQGRGAILLVPEIVLTPQLLDSLSAHFGDEIAVLHSALRSGERYDEWKRVRQGRARVVIGTRSAVFAPVRDLGLIILDEEQEPSYKSENTPRYHAREVAKYRCVQHGALLVLGSATPSLESMYLARKGVYHLQTLHKRYKDRALPRVLTADMRQELRAGNSGSVSAALRRELEHNLDLGEQSILFLNRRGASRLVSCGECGYVPECPRCEVHLTYHSANQRLMCHHCGHSQPYEPFCPQCGGRFRLLGTGTQKLQSELQDLFPGTEIMRMDTDTVSATQPHEKLLARFRDKKVPILVGTQMVAKGLDFENVTLVGVVDADLALYVDDFRASERTFSLLTQVVGRAGRGNRSGRAVIQTCTPDHEVLRFAARQDYDSFYEQEIALRELRGFPPFCDLFVLSVTGTDEERVLQGCMILRSSLEAAAKAGQAPEGLRVLGPAPDRVPRVNQRYRYHLTLCGRNTKPLRSLISGLLRAAHEDKRMRGISVFADCNPLD